MSRYSINTKSGGAVPAPKPPPPTPKAKPVTKTPAPPAAVAPPNSSAKAIIDNANRLGLTWTMRPATVSSLAFTTTTNPTHIIYDGDTATVAAVSVCGVPPPGSRVLCIQLPPSGNFIIGSLSGTTQSQLVARDRAVTVNDFTITTVQQDITESAVSFDNIKGGFYWEAYGSFDVRTTVAGTAQIFGLLSGPAGVEATVASYGFTGATGERSQVAQLWEGYEESGSSADFVLRIVKSAASGTMIAEGGNTLLTVKIYQ
jgi:hypothetical protein